VLACAGLHNSQRKDVNARPIAALIREIVIDPRRAAVSRGECGCDTIER
jgi:hypothetical protein